MRLNLNFKKRVYPPKSGCQGVFQKNLPWSAENWPGQKIKHHVVGAAVDVDGVAA